MWQIKQKAEINHSLINSENIAKVKEGAVKELLCNMAESIIDKVSVDQNHDSTTSITTFTAELAIMDGKKYVEFRNAAKEYISKTNDLGIKELFDKYEI